MKVKDPIVKSAIASILALTVTGTLTAAAHAITAQAKTEKCYGIVKAGMNDCQTSKQACAGSSTKDNQPDAFILVPKGLCNKIVGGSLTPKADTEKK